MIPYEIIEMYVCVTGHVYQTAGIRDGVTARETRVCCELLGWQIGFGSRSGRGVHWIYLRV